MTTFKTLSVNVIDHEGTKLTKRDGTPITRPLRFTPKKEPAVVMSKKIYLCTAVDPKTVQLTTKTVRSARVANKEDIGQKNAEARKNDAIDAFTKAASASTKVNGKSKKLDAKTQAMVDAFKQLPPEVLEALRNA